MEKSLLQKQFTNLSHLLYLMIITVKQYGNRNSTEMQHRAARANMQQIKETEAEPVKL